MQVIYSSQTAYNHIRQETLVGGGFADGKDTSGKSASAADQLVAKLAENIPGMSLSEMKGMDANDYSPEKVALRISDFVAQGLENARARGASEERLEQMYQAAVAGVEKGFKEATEILDELGMLNEETTANIEQTKDLTFEALAGLAPGSNETAPSRQVSLSAAERFSQSESFSLKVMTKEGDKVTIKFNGSETETTSLGYYSDDEASAVSFGVDRTESSSYKFSVKGDLNEEELDALQTLIQDINLIAEDFFSGDIQDAFEQATELEMDKSQLMNLNVSMSQSVSYSAVTAYQEVQQMDNPLGNNGRHLGQLMNNMDRFMNHHSLDPFESIRSFGQSLLQNLIREDVRYKDSDDESRNKLEDNINLLTDSAPQFDLDDADD
ncbi:MAG: DUF5610 domain-containing protein [Neptuniibacter sp.]